jgi:hypothetical protein
MSNIITGVLCFLCKEQKKAKESKSERQKCCTAGFEDREVTISHRKQVASKHWKI